MGLKKWWYFKVKNPVVRVGEAGGFKWCFRRFTLDVETVSGNWKARWTAGEHPYAYLLAGKTDENIIGFCQLMYQLGSLLTTEQKFVNDVQSALRRYNKRLQESAPVTEDPAEEAAAIAEQRALQEYVEKPEKERRKLEREANGRFKKVVKEIGDEK